MRTKQSDISYIIYARKSSESDEKQIQSIDDQLRVMKDLARDLDLTIVDTLSEARSAKEPHGRPVFETLIQRIQSGEADGILTWKIDRLSRNPIDSATVQWLLQQEKIKSIQTIGREYLSEDNAVILSIESSMANQYIRDLSKNVKRGLKSKVEKGIAPICAPIGYLNTKIEARGSNYITKDPERFPIVRKAWDLMLTGNYSGPMVLDKLNNEYGLRTRKMRRNGGKPLSRGGLYRMFSDPFYTGQFRYMGTMYEGIHKPMVSHAEFERVQEILGRPEKIKQYRHNYIYAGYLHCGECGGRVSATHKEKVLKNGKLKYYTLYYCIPASKRTRPCSQRQYTNSDLIDEQVKAEIESFAILPEFRDWALKILYENDVTEDEEVEHIQASQQKAISDAQSQLNKLTDMCAKGMLPDDEYKEKRADHVTAISTLKANMQKTDTHLLGLREQTKQVLDFATEAYAVFESDDIEDKRNAFSMMRWNSTLQDKKLVMQACFWLTPIKEQYSPILEKMKALELQHGRRTKRYKEALAALNPLVRALVDAIGEGLKEHPITICPQLVDKRGAQQTQNGPTGHIRPPTQLC